MKASELLRRAREILAATPVPRKARGLCACVSDAAEIAGCRHDQYRVLARINHLLFPRGYLWAWLVEQGHTTFDEIGTPNGLLKLRTTRFAWIDDLIAYFEAQGD